MLIENIHSECFVDFYVGWALPTLLLDEFRSDTQ